MPDATIFPAAAAVLMTHEELRARARKLLEEGQRDARLRQIYHPGAGFFTPAEAVEGRQCGWGLDRKI